MKSAAPKVLHVVGGQPMLAHVLATARSLNAAKIVVVIAEDAGEVSSLAEKFGAETAIQKSPLGTGHAVVAAEGALKISPATF